MLRDPPLRLVLPLLLLLATGCLTAHRPSVHTTAPPPQKPLPIPVVELDGDPRAIGLAHGRELSAQIHELEQTFLDPQLGDTAQRTIAYTAAVMFETKITPDHRQEIYALAEGSAMDPRQAMLAQCFLDLTDTVACSTIALPASAAPDGIVRMGRNLDFPGRNVLDKMSVLFVYRPAGKHQFVAVGWPGMVGVVSGMNEHGLTLANMEVPRARRWPSGMPYALLYRTLLEECQTVDEAIDLLSATPRQSANNLMLMDASGDRALVEIKPDSLTVRRARQDQALISTNHQRGKDLDSLGHCRRYDSLYQSAKDRFGHIDVPQIESMLDAAQQPTWTIQSMVFEPENRVMYLATGMNATTQEYFRVDLNKYFAGSTASR